MPFVEHDGLRFYYRLEGRESLPVLLLSHCLGADHGLWDPQLGGFLNHFRVLRYDHRGHGASAAPAGEYSIEMLAKDALAIAGALGIGRFAFCGLSLGGMVGQWLGARAPERLTRLVLANTTPRFADPAPTEARRRAVLAEGMSAVVDPVMQRFFTPESIAADLAAASTIRRLILGTNPVGYAGCCAAVRDLSQVDLLASIRVPTLVIGGTRDPSTPWEGNGSVLAAKIPGAKTVMFPTAHLSNLERPAEFEAAVSEFLLG